jgi:hypothetical protein
MYWAYDRDAGYGLLDVHGTEKSELLNALVRPYPELVSGDPIRVSFDPSTRAFSFTWRPDTRLNLPTEISVPVRTYPSGYHAICEGSQLDALPTRLLIQRTPAGNDVTLSITPKRGSSRR